MRKATIFFFIGLVSLLLAVNLNGYAGILAAFAGGFFNWGAVLAAYDAGKASAAVKPAEDFEAMRAGMLKAGAEFSKKLKSEVSK